LCGFHLASLGFIVRNSRSGLGPPRSRVPVLEPVDHVEEVCGQAIPDRVVDRRQWSCVAPLNRDLYLLSGIKSVPAVSQPLLRVNV
jgi:hypothetical protein